MKYSTFLTIIIMVSLIVLWILFYKIRVAMIDLDELNLQIPESELAE